ncbi:baseplate J/gp47 family protein [Patescibacteria group bacterium]|nr:baseplate J/gp47 family protein [Patescibacteria group bacterium]
MYVGRIETGKSYKKIIFIFAVISLLLIGFVLYASFSKADIKITPKKEIINTEYEVSIKPNEDLDLTQLQNIQGRMIQTEAEETQTITDIGLKTIDTRATGTITIYNKLDESQSLLPHSQMLSDSGILFRTDARVVIPAHSKAEVGITADQAGAQGNIEPTHFTIVKIWQNWQSSYYGETSAATTGGTQEVKVATQEVIDQAQQQVIDSLYQKGLENLRTQLKPKEEINEKAIKKEIVISEASVKPDTPTEEFAMKVKLKLIAVIFDEQTLIDLGVARIKKKISASKEFTSSDADQTTYEIIEYHPEEGWAKVKVNLVGSAISKLGNQVFDKEQLAGRNKEEVEKYYAVMDDIEKIEVSFSPFWVKSVPSLKDHIEITVEK